MKASVFVAFLVLVHTSLAQYGGKRNYQKSSKGSPMEMLVISPDSMMKSKDSYKNMMSGSPMRSSMMSQMMPMKETGDNYRSGGNMPSKNMMMDMYQRQQDGQQIQRGEQLIRAAVKTHHTIDYIDVPIEPLDIKPQTILVEANNIPLNILFQSRSSELNLQNEHMPSKGSVQETSSEDEPHRLIHKVTKPIYQEIFELIKPYRKITQEITPVQEEIQTIVARTVPDSKYVPVNNQFKGKNNLNAANSAYMNGRNMDANMNNNLDANMSPNDDVSMNDMLGGGYINRNMMNMNMIKMAPQHPPPMMSANSYDSDDNDIISKMINAIKMKEMNKKTTYMQMPRQYTSSTSYQPNEGSMIKMYQMGQYRAMPIEQMTMDKHSAETPQSNKMESLPLIKMFDSDMDKSMSMGQASDDIGIGQERHVSTEEIENPKLIAEKQEKTMQSVMMYGGTNAAQMMKVDSSSVNKNNNNNNEDKNNDLAPPTMTTRNFAQKSNYAESNTEPTGY